MTIRYLVDTDWVIDHLNQIERVVTRLQELRPQGLAISIVSLATSISSSRDWPALRADAAHKQPPTL